MDKIRLIIKREYLTRVRKRSFLLATLLTPLGLLVFLGVAGWIISYDSDDERRIAVVDEAGVFPGGIKDERSVRFFKVARALDDVKAEAAAGEYDGVLLIPPIDDLRAGDFETLFYSDATLTPDVRLALVSRVRDAVREYRATQLGLDAADLAALRFDVDVEPEPIAEDGRDASAMTSAVGTGLGSVMGFAMYFMIFTYGAMVMRSVMEEKTTRIVEVMISSVKPFQLMMGKVVGVGLVGLTQVGLWLVLIPAIVALGTAVFGFDGAAATASANPAAAGVDPEEAADLVAQLLVEIGAINWWAILPLFVLYFLGGYFVYASLFAAVGSAVGEDMNDAQSLTFPIMIPVLLAFYIMTVAVQSPNSSLAVWSSVFPLFSPIIMPARLAFEPPFWQVALSMAVLFATAVALVWLSARVYRTGILLYGKKASLRELGRWMVRG